MEALGALCADDLEAYPFPDWPDDPVYYGPEGMTRLAGSWWELFSGTHLKIERLIEQGDRVVVLTTHTGVSGGVKIEQPLGMLLDLRDGKLWRARFVLGFDKTLEEAGL